MTDLKPDSRICAECGVKYYPLNHFYKGFNFCSAACKKEGKKKIKDLQQADKVDEQRGN